MSRIFISYRRADSRAITDRIYERLARSFGAKDIFRDIQTIAPGMDFRAAVEKAILGTEVVLVIIGPQWLAITEDRWQRHEDDWARLEVELALRHAKRIIPILVDGAPMPSAADLPADIQPLAYRNAMQVRFDPDFAYDMDRLIAALDQLLPPDQAEEPQTLASQPVDRETREAPTHALSRRLEAAMPQQCRAGADTELLVKVSLPDSVGLRGELPKVVESGDVIHKENVRGSTAALTFPVDPRTGQLQPGTACIEVQARDFIVTAATPQTSACAADQVALEVPPDADSRTVIFQLAPRPGTPSQGRSRVFIRLYQDDRLIAETAVSTELVSEVEHLPLKAYWALVAQPLTLAAATAASPRLDIRQQADHSGNVAQIGQAGNVTINNYGGAPPPAAPPARPRVTSPAPRTRYPLIGLLATLAVVVFGIVAILPGILSGSPASSTGIAIVPTTVVPATTAPAMVITDTPAPTDMPTATRTPQPTIDTPGPSREPSSTWTPTYPSTNQAATPATSVPGGITVTLYRDANSLTLYLPNQGNVSLAGLAFRVNKAEGPIDYSLQGFEFGLPLETLPTPMCLRLERSRSTDPLPIACTILSPQGRVIRRPLAEADIFWHNGRIAFPVLIYAGDMLVGIFGTDSAEYSFVYPPPTSEISISVEVGDWDSGRRDCFATVHVNVSGAPVIGNIHVWNGYYGPDGDVFSSQTFPSGESVHTVTLGGRDEQFKMHEIWITSDIGASNRVGGLVCNNWGG